MFFERFGRRKSWLVPVQYLIGLFLFVLSYNIKSLLGEDPNNPETSKLLVFALLINNHYWIYYHSHPNISICTKQLRFENPAGRTLAVDSYHKISYIQDSNYKEKFKVIRRLPRTVVKNQHSIYYLTYQFV